MRYGSVERDPLERSRAASMASIAACSAFLLLLFAVNMLRTDLDPTWHFISEYENGRLGWAMQLAFVLLAIAHFSLIGSLLPWLTGKLGRVGIGLLFAAGLSLLLAGLFKADPVQTPADQTTLTGSIHNTAGALGLAMTFAVALVTVALRRVPEWRDGQRMILPLAIVAIVSSVATIIAFVVYLSGSGGVVGPDAPLGIFNRLEIIAYTVWFLSVAWTAKSISA